MYKFSVKPVGTLGVLAEYLTLPAAWLWRYLWTGVWFGSVNRTRPWNHRRLFPRELPYIKKNMMVFCEGIPDAGPRRKWNRYVILRPSDPTVNNWYVGRVYGTPAQGGVSRILIKGNRPVRVLIGPGDVYFGGFSARTGEQIPMQDCGRGRGDVQSAQLQIDLH